MMADKVQYKVVIEIKQEHDGRQMLQQMFLTLIQFIIYIIIKFVNIVTCT